MGTIKVARGAFHARFTDSFTGQGVAAVERVSIEGRVSARRVNATFSVHVTATRPSGSGFECQLGPVPLTASD